MCRRAPLVLLLALAGLAPAARAQTIMTRVSASPMGGQWLYVEVTSSPSDIVDIAIGVDGDGNVTVNGDVVMDGAGPLAGGDLVSVVFTGSDGTDRLTVSADLIALRQVVALGGQGDDRLEGHPTARNRLYGGPGNDELVGGEAGDTLWGEAGIDVLNGRGGDDSLYGGPGNDTSDGGDGNDRLLDVDGDDLLLGGPGDDGINALEGEGDPSGTDDVIDAGEGDDRIIAFGGTVRGGPGGDLIEGDLRGTVLIDGGDGADVFRLVDETDGPDPAVLHALVTPISEPGTFDLVRREPCCSGATVRNLEEVDLQLTGEDDGVVIDDVSSAGVEAVRVDGLGGDDTVVVRGTSGDDEFRVNAGFRLSYNSAFSMDFYRLELLAIEGFSSFSATPSGNDTVYTVGLTDTRQFFRGGDGVDGLILNRDGRTATDQGTYVDLSGAQPVQFEDATVSIENDPLTNTPPDAGDVWRVSRPEDVPVWLRVRDPVPIDWRRAGGAPDSDDDAVEVTAVTQPTGGTAELFPLGYIEFTPDPDFFGSTSFTYTLDDRRGGTAEGTVTIDVEPVNDAPRAAAVTAPAEIVFEGDPGATVDLTWDPAPDPEGDPVAYQWQVYADEALTEPVFFSPVVTGTSVSVPLGDLGQAVAPLPSGSSRTFYHLVEAADAEDAERGPATAVTLTGGAITPAEPGIVARFLVRGSVPNPASDWATVRFDLPAASAVSLRLYDAVGREVGASGPHALPAGRAREVAVDVRGLPSGLYVYRLSVAGPEGMNSAAGRITVAR